MDEQLNINVENAGTNSSITLLKGDAPAPIELKSFSVSGDLDAPANFYAKNQDLVKDLDSIVTIDQEKMTIKLVIGYNHPHSRTVTGRVMLNPYFENLGINTTQKYHRKQLVDKLKFLRRYFPAPSDCLDLVDKFKKLEADVDLRIRQSDDERGNKLSLVEQSVDNLSFPRSFFLEMPILLGTIPVRFEIDILFDLQGKDLVFWLESIQADELIFNESQKMLEDSVRLFEDDDSLPVIYA